MNTHKHRDFRSLSEEAQAEVRRLALAESNQGQSDKTIADRYEIHYKTVYDWRTKQKALKEREYKGEKRGRQKDEQKFIKPSMEIKISTIIKQKTPDALHIQATLWDRRAIQELIRIKIHKKISLQRVSDYTKRWGLTPQRPAKYAAEQDDKKLQEWLTATYPAIQKRAEKEGAEIHWEDESGISLKTYYARGYAPKGITPIIKLPAKQARISMISSITNRGDMQFMLYEKGLKVPLFIEFLTRLILHRKGKKIFIIVDNLRVHHAKKVQQWIESHKHEIEIFFPTTILSTAQSR
jgi:transposase